MQVSSIFSIRGRGMVLAGVIRRGVVTIGDRLSVAAPQAVKSAIVAGLERVGTHELVDNAKQGDEVAILCRGVETDDIRDGLERVDEIGWKVVDLTVRSPESLGSRLWRRMRRS